MLREIVDKIITTPAQENYIETIYQLSLRGPVRPGALASTLGVKRASVSKYIITLVSKGLVKHVPRGDIYLTDQGVALAKSILKRDHCLTRLLVDVCNMTPEEAEPEVHRLEHLISDDVLFRLETLVEFACTSSAWLKRLHLRVEAEHSRYAEQQNLRVGSSQVHQGDDQEKVGGS